jgi:bacteriorhodopsin
MSPLFMGCQYLIVASRNKLLYLWRLLLIKKLRFGFQFVSLLPYVCYHAMLRTQQLLNSSKYQVHKNVTKNVSCFHSSCYSNDGLLHMRYSKDNNCIRSFFLQKPIGLFSEIYCKRQTQWALSLPCHVFKLQMAKEASR